MKTYNQTNSPLLLASMQITIPMRKQMQWFQIPERI